MSAFGGQRVTGKLQLRLRHSDLLKNLPLNWTGKIAGVNTGVNIRGIVGGRACARKKELV
jgi:hypothetical protein